MRFLLLLALLNIGVCSASIGGLHWTTWDNRQSCQPLDFFQPQTEEELIKYIRETNQTLKVVGAGHSFSPIALTEGHMISLDYLNDVVKVEKHCDGNYSHVTVGAGIRLHDLNSKLEALGLALENMGATAQQSFAGATATGTHGTGQELGSLSTQIVGVRMVTASGDIVEINDHSPLLNAARLSLGALGIITYVKVRVVDMFKMRLDQIPFDLDELMKALPELLKEHPRLQWYWTPYTQNATLVLRTPTDEPITGCWDSHDRIPEYKATILNGATSCVDVSYKTLTGSQEHYATRALYTEMEMFVPQHLALPAVLDFLQFQKSVQSKHTSSVPLFTGVRYVQADEIWLSPQYLQDTAVISFIVSGDKTTTGNPAEFAMYSHALQDTCIQKYSGRAHWGKMNYMTGEEVAAMYPMLNEFKKLRAKLDPHGRFLNDYLSNLLI